MHAAHGKQLFCVQSHIISFQTKGSLYDFCMEPWWRSVQRNYLFIFEFHTSAEIESNARNAKMPNSKIKSIWITGDGRNVKKRQFPLHHSIRFSTKISANRLLPLLNCKHINPLATFPPHIVWTTRKSQVNCRTCSCSLIIAFRMWQFRSNGRKWTTIYATSVLEFRSATAFTSFSDNSLSDACRCETYRSGVKSM